MPQLVQATIFSFGTYAVAAAMTAATSSGVSTAPFAAEARLPVDIGLDAIAVADVDRGGAGEALDRAMQRRDAPILDLVHVDVERRLVELDDVDAVGLERSRLLVEQRCECHRRLHAVAVM